MIISGGAYGLFSRQPGLQLLPTSKLPASPFGWTLSTDFLGYFFVLKQWDPISNVSQIQMSMASNSLRYCNSIRWQVSNDQCWIICGLEWLEEHCGQASPTQNACRTERFFCHNLGLIVSRTFGLYVMWRRDFSSPRPKLQRRAIFWVHTPGPSTTTLERVLQPGWSWHKIVLELQNHLRHVISGLFDQFDPARLRSSLGVCLLRCSLRSHGKEVSNE